MTFEAFCVTIGCGEESGPQAEQRAAPRGSCAAFRLCSRAGPRLVPAAVTGVGFALINGIGNVGGLLGTYVGGWLKDATGGDPATSQAPFAVSIAGAAVLMLALSRRAGVGSPVARAASSGGWACGVVPLGGDEPAVPGEQGGGGDAEDLSPASTGYQRGQGANPNRSAGS